MERVKYNGTIKPNLATNSAARSFIVSVDPNSNNAVSWDRGYHFNDVNTVAPVHSNGLTSNKIVGSNISYYGVNNANSWNGQYSNKYNLSQLANAQIDPYDYYGSLYDPVRTSKLTIIPGSSSTVGFGKPGYAGPATDTWGEYFIQSVGIPGQAWAKKVFTNTPYYSPTLLNPMPSTIYYNDVSPSIPKAQNLHMNKLSFSDSITASMTFTTNVSNYSVVSGYTVSNVSLSPFRMLLAVVNTQGNWEYCHIPLHVSSGGDFTFKKNSDNQFVLKDTITFKAYLDRECLRKCQDYLKAGISSGLFDGSTTRYFCTLSWETQWRFPSLPGNGTSESTIGTAGHISTFRVAWSINNTNHSKYQISNIEQIQ